jgi:hypothetical protein
LSDLLGLDLAARALYQLQDERRIQMLCCPAEVKECPEVKEVAKLALLKTDASGS